MFIFIESLFNNKSSQRQFYTLPSTTIPNDQGGFANWLYNRGPSCKQGNGDQCWRNVSQMGAIGGGGKGGVAGAGK